MTFAGKILVIVIMGFALFFLAISAVVFATAPSWKKDTDKQKAIAKPLQDALTAAKADAATLETELANAKNARRTDAGKWESLKANLDAQNKQLQSEITEQRKSLESALQNTKTTVEEADARKKETDGLHEQLAAIQKQAKEYKDRQTELNERIRILQREVDVAKKNNAQLH
jgi:uncharacterized coiled-coil DUF342 family protein